MLYFDPQWKDDRLFIEAMQVPLILPEASDINQDYFIRKKFSFEEDFFGESYLHGEKHAITGLFYRYSTKKSMVFRNQDEERVEMPKNALDMVFPPKALMTDSLQERSMMYCAALEAKGNILVGGLGLCIYPQMVIQLGRAVDKITVVDNCQEIIDLVWNNFQKTAPDDILHKINIVHDDIYNYLEYCNEEYDTIYLDIWGDMEFRYLSNINHLVSLSHRYMRPSGRIYCWGYTRIVETFVELIRKLEEHEFFNSDLSDYLFDPLISHYIRLRSKDIEMAINEVANIALTINKRSELNYLNQCYTPFRQRMISPLTLI